MVSEGKEAKPVKLMAALLYRDLMWLERALEQLSAAWSPIDYRGEPVAFDRTRYYEPEMGSELMRLLVSFKQPVPPEHLVAAKHRATALEVSLSENGKRRVNIDPGYLDRFKLVLASFKERGNKVYLGRGVWADPILYFEKGRFQAFPWTFPDFAAGLYARDLSSIRELYLESMRA